MHRASYLDGKFREQLGNISNNMLIGAVNAHNGEVNNIQTHDNGVYGVVADTVRA